MKLLLFIAVLAQAAFAQSNLTLLGMGGNGGLVAITLDGTCSGTGSTQTIACSAAMTVTAGDTIACTGSASGGSDPATLYFNDVTNGMYDNIEGIVHPNAATTTFVATAVFQNSASGSITPQVNNWEGPANMQLKCRAFRGTRSSLVVDSGSVNQTNSTTAANPTSGTAAAPTNANEVVIGAMVRAATSAVSDAGPWVPGGTITAVGTTYPIYDHYQIQASAVTANSPMTAASTAFIDTQFALLNASNPSGYRGVTGFYGIPAIAKTNAASVTAADLNGATTTLTTLKANATWALTGTAAAYDTSITPSGTGHILAQGIGHSFGDAATSVKFTGAQTNNFYTWGDQIRAPGSPMWLSTFFRMGATGTVSGQLCDSLEMQGGTTENTFWIQPKYDSVAGLEFALEPNEGGLSPYAAASFTLDTDYRIQLHIAGSSERFHQLIVQSKSGSVWSVAATVNFDVLCTVLAATGCTTPTSTGSGTGSASSGSTSLTITSSTGSIVAGQVVIPQTGIAYLTAVESIAGTCATSCTITLSQKTTAAISATVGFITKPTQFVAATNGTMSAGSTAVTVVVPGSGVIAVGDAIGGTGIATGTLVSAISGTSLTLSQPSTAATTNAGIWFWQPPNTTGGVGISFGKFSSCTVAGPEWFSGMHFDPTGAWGAYLPN
jgi:hypothetical protein